MSGNNPFDIKNKPEEKKDESVRYKKNGKKELTVEQKKSLLKGYIEVPRSKWGEIPVNSHIRYIKKDGTFVRGGFVVNHWLNKTGQPFIHLANGFKKSVPGYATWPMAHESAKHVFKKPNSKNGIEMDVVKRKNKEIISQINKIVDAVKDLKKRVEKNEQDMRRIFILLSKIDKKISER
jgi:flagellar capping protein FliD